MSNDLFEKIVRREIDADIVFENDDILAFRDVNPQAPVAYSDHPQAPDSDHQRP